MKHLCWRFLREIVTAGGFKLLPISTIYHHHRCLIGFKILLSFNFVYWWGSKHEIGNLDILILVIWQYITEVPYKWWSSNTKKNEKAQFSATTWLSSFAIVIKNNLYIFENLHHAYHVLSCVINSADGKLPLLPKEYKRNFSINANKRLRNIEQIWFDKTKFLIAIFSLITAKSTWWKSVLSSQIMLQTGTME